MKAKIVLNYKTAQEAESVASGVQPDNIKLPTGLSIKTLRLGKEVHTQIKCETRLQTFMATLDDFLSAVSTVEKTIAVIKAAERKTPT